MNQKTKRPKGTRAKKDESGVDSRKVFVIFGRDLRARDAMFEFLRALDLKPIEWDKAVSMTGQASPYVGQVLEAGFAGAQAVIALFTGDDEARLRDALLKEGQESEPTAPQPRPNVLFEAGRAHGSHPDRTVIVHVGKLRSISDLEGRHVVHVEKGRPWRREIADRLRTAGCAVDTDHHHDWEKAGPGLEEAGVRTAARPTAVAPTPAKPLDPPEQSPPSTANNSRFVITNPRRGW